MKTTVTTAIALTALLSAGFASGAEMVQFSPGMPARAADFNGNFANLNGRADDAENRIAGLEDAVGKMTELIWPTIHGHRFKNSSALRTQTG